MTATTARLEGIAVERVARPGRRPGRRPRPGWTNGAPWAGLGAIVVAVALWVVVVAGVALPLGAWLGRVDGARPPGGAQASAAAPGSGEGTRPPLVGSATFRAAP